MWLVTRGWSPPFAYRTGQVPARDFVARTQFQQPDPQGLERAREAARERARSQTLAVYSHEAMPLEELRHALKNRVFQVLGAETFADLEEGVWEDHFCDNVQHMCNSQVFCMIGCSSFH